MPTDLELETLKANYQKYGQEHVFRFWHELTSAQQEKFFKQLKTINLSLIANLSEKFVLQQGEKKEVSRKLAPAEVIPLPHSDQQLKQAAKAQQIGEEHLRAGKVGIILVAGGQGTRLGYEGAKGKFPITPVKGKTLFQFHAEKIGALSKRYQKKMPWYIMTSEANDEETRDYFVHNSFFGLDKNQVFFFQQSMIPAVNAKGKLFLERKDRVFTNPNGHGGTLQALRESGALTDMQQRGIEQLFYFQVDNVLIKICDPVFIGYHAQQDAQMSSKVVAKRDPHEKVGVLVYLNQKLTVIEYSDLYDEEMQQRNPDGSLRYNAGSIAIHVLRRDFVEKLTEGDFSLPYHLAHKKIPFIDEAGESISPSTPNGFKFEMFIFDALQFTTNSVAMEVERKEEFSPVKNAEGIDSPQTAKQDLCNLYASWLEAAEVTVPRNKYGSVQGEVEISPLFALDKEQFLRKAPNDLIFRDGLYVE